MESFQTVSDKPKTNHSTTHTNPIEIGVGSIKFSIQGIERLPDYEVKRKGDDLMITFRFSQES